jgi:acyl-CoA synthetase (AMP-forming)/AMP-acid ligase II
MPTTDSANIARHLPLMAARQPDYPALKIPRGRTRAGDIDYLTLTFAELDAEVAAWAARITAAGVKTDDRVLVMVRQGLPLIAAAFALFKIGAVPVVIDPGMGLKNFLTCVERTQPRALLGIPLARIISRVFRKPFRNVTIRIPASSSPTARLAPASALQLSTFNLQLVSRNATDLAAILFTSGSTGAPKGVCYEHGMFEAQVRLIRATYGIQPGEVDLPMLPIFALFNPALGMTTIVPEIDPARPAAVDPAKIVQAIRQENVTNSFGSPTLWAKIADHCLSTHTTLPSLRRVLCAGAPVPETLWENSRRVLTHGQLHSPYGATEALPIASVCAAEIIPRAGAVTAAPAKHPVPSNKSQEASPSSLGECHVLRDTSQTPFSLGQPTQCHVLRDTFSAPAASSQHSVSNLSVSGSVMPGACVGRPLPGIDVRIIAIVDNPIAMIDDVRELRSGEIGEIIVRGPVVTKNYDALAEATAAAKIAVENTQHPRFNTQRPTHAADHLSVKRSALSVARSPASPVPALDVGRTMLGVGSSPAAPWHRMGDCGTFDPLGRLWFCGRKVERVLTIDGPLFTEPCEQVFRSHPQVARCALIGLGVPGKQLPALVIQPREKLSASAKAALARELRALAAAYTSTAGITRFYFHKAFPVDVRHNAKIHRLTLAKWATAHPALEFKIDA